MGYQWALSEARESTTEQSLGGNATELVGWALTEAPMKLEPVDRVGLENPHNHW